MEQVLHGQLPKLAISHELSENLLVAFHAVDDEALEGFLEDVAEVVLRVRGGGFLQRLALDGLFLNLVKEELVGLGEVRAEALVEDVDEFGELDLLIFLPGADVTRAFERLAVAGVEIDLAFADLLQPVVLQLNLVFEVIARARCRASAAW